MDSLADISGLEPGPPPTGDGVLGGVDDDVVLIAGHAAGEEGVDALVEGAALVLTHEQEHRDAGLEQLERAVEEVVRGDVADALPLHLLEQAHGVQDGLAPQRARADEHGVVGQRVLPGELLGARLEALADVEHVLPDVLRLLDEQVELREAAATVEEAGLLTPTRGPNGYRRYVSADIDRLQEILLLRHIGVGIAEMYVADERFTSYYDEVVKGCAAWLRDAVIARAR